MTFRSRIGVATVAVSVVGLSAAVGPSFGFASANPCSPTVRFASSTIEKSVSPLIDEWNWKSNRFQGGISTPDDLSGTGTAIGEAFSSTSLRSPSGSALAIPGRGTVSIKDGSTTSTVDIPYLYLSGDPYYRGLIDALPLRWIDDQTVLFESLFFFGQDGNNPGQAGLFVVRLGKSVEAEPIDLGEGSWWIAPRFVRAPGSPMETIPLIGAPRLQQATRFAFFNPATLTIEEQSSPGGALNVVDWDGSRLVLSRMGEPTDAVAYPLSVIVGSPGLPSRTIRVADSVSYGPQSQLSGSSSWLSTEGTRFAFYSAGRLTVVELSSGARTVTDVPRQFKTPDERSVVVRWSCDRPVISVQSSKYLAVLDGKKWRVLEANELRRRKIDFVYPELSQP